MEGLLRFRHNVMSVSAISTFENVKGGVNNNCKDVYFVRAVGVNSTYIKDIEQLDDTLMRRMNNGNGYYYRINELPKLQKAEDIAFYSESYANWLNSNKREVVVRATEKNKLLATMLANACCMIESKFVQENKQISESMIKNFIVKAMFWYDFLFANKQFTDQAQQWDERKSAKIVAANVEKKQEYLFFYLVTLMGCDVLLLQCRGDISTEEDKLGLSTQFVLGNFSESVIPEYQWKSTEPVKVQSASGNSTVVNQERSSNGRIVMQIPEHRRPERKPPQQSTGQQETAEKSFEELAQLASSVVLIQIHDNKGDIIGSGSGIMIGRDGYILTNNHVACGGKYYTVRIEDDNQVYRTDEVIKYHPVLDLAIIRIQRKLNPIRVYNGKKPLVRGQKVVAIGSPLGLFNSVSDGIISGFRKIDNVDMIQFTAPTSRGSSGGAVLNMQGEVIGISTAGIDSGQNINLAMGYECVNMFIQGFV